MTSSSFGNRPILRWFLPLAGSLLALCLSSCGGSSSSPLAGPGPSPSPSFSISVSPQTETIDQGQSATLTLSVSPANGFSQTIEVTVASLPNGVTTSPASPFSMSNSGQAVALTVSSSAALGSATITFDASSGSLQTSTQATVSVAQAPPSLPNDRTSFVRTDDTPLAVVYDPAHQLLFASALHLNCVDVISVVTKQVVKCVPVSGALGLSLSADGTQVLVGTQVGVIAWISTSSLQVVKRTVVPQIPQNATTPPSMTYVPAAQAYEAANGKILLFSNWGYKDLYGNFKPAAVVEWDPATGTSTPRPDSGGGGLVSISADHSKMLIAGQGQATLYDSATDSFTPIPNFAGVYQPAINPSGTQFALVDGSPLIQFFNAQMQPVGSLDLSICCGFRPSGAVYSSDGKYLYVVLPNYVPTLVTVDSTTFKVIGTAEAYSSEIAYFSSLNIVGHPQAADSTGLVFEIANHGVAINDATDFHDFPVTGASNDFIIATPDEGPTSQPTTTKFTTSIFSSVPDVFFGGQRGLNPYLNSGSNLVATAPPSSAAGPVNVKVVQSDGLMAFMPQGFTYGSLPVQYGLLASTPQGGVLAQLFGYGYSVDIPGAEIEVRIGSSQATLQEKHLFPTESLYPFPLQHLVVSVPSGSPGPQDITVSSPAGTATSSHAFHYVKSVVDYPSPDSFLYVLYDSHRDQVYLSAGDHIDVFSLATYSFGAPISVPSNGGTRLILGLALTPDGSKLLAANQSDQSVAIINPDDPGSGAVAVSLPLAGIQGSPGPFQIAATSTNQAFVTVTVGNTLSGGSSSIYDIDLATLQVTTPTLPPGALLNLNNNYIQASADGTVVFEGTSNASAGPLLSWQATSNNWQSHFVAGQFWDDIAVSGDGNVLAVDSSPDSLGFPFPYLLDPQLHLTTQVNFPEFQSIQEGPTLQLDQSGALLYAVNPTGVDLLDARTGQLAERILLSEPVLHGPTEVLQTPSKVMAITPAGDQIFLLTTAGLTVVELDSVPLGIGSVTPVSGPGGSVVTLRGTGFVSGTSVKVNGIQASASLVDASTLTVTIPASVQQGPAQFVLTNPDGSSFSLDAAFLVQ